MIAKDPRGRWMRSKDRPGLYGHESGGVEIAAPSEGVFCFPDGRIVLTDQAVRHRRDVRSGEGHGCAGRSREGHFPRTIAEPFAQLALEVARVLTAGSLRTQAAKREASALLRPLILISACDGERRRDPVSSPVEKPPPPCQGSTCNSTTLAVGRPFPASCA